MDLKWMLKFECSIMGGQTHGEDEEVKESDYCNNHQQMEKCGEEAAAAAAEDVAGGFFQMPVHYPRYKKGEYEEMEEWKLDLLLREYGLTSFIKGTLQQKRRFAIGAFLWPDQL